MSIEAPGSDPQRARFERIVECGLCIGCGLCESLAGCNTIQMTVVASGEQRPRVTGSLDRTTVDLIYDTCPGTRARGLPAAALAADRQTDPVWGDYQRMVLAHAADPAVRFRGATGGVLTALALYLLESREVAFVLHARPSTRLPLGGEAQVSETPAQVLAGAGSRYGPTAPLRDIRRLLEREQPFAFVGKPCDIGALRNYARHDPRVDRLVRYWLTPVCGGYSPPSVTQAFLRGLGVAADQVAALSYRGNGCPGPVRVETTDGRVIERNYLDLWGEDESAWRLPFRCKVCPDGIGEAADLAAADTWPGGSPPRHGQERDPGTNALIVRTRAGAALLDAALAAGYLAFDAAIGPAAMSDYQPHQVNKKRTVWARHAGLRAAGQLAPATQNLRLRELAAGMGVRFNLAQARGTRQRVHAGRTRERAPGHEES